MEVKEEHIQNVRNNGNIIIILNILTIGEQDLVEFLTEEILAERKAQKVKAIPTELNGFTASLNGAEVTMTKKTGEEM